MRSLAWILLILLACTSCAPARTSVVDRGSPPVAAPTQEPITRIAFGSCAKEQQPQPIWEAIVQAKPELFLFLGDNIYADTEDVEVMRAKYARLAGQPGYQKLKQCCRVLATWDDHDYGADDAGSEYPMKRESQQLFLDFFDEPADSPRRAREGVYDASLHGPAGKRVQVILLDTRYFRSALVQGKESEARAKRRGPYVPTSDPNATILGEQQWLWLEEQMRTPAELRVLCSSIQVLANEHGFECWGNFPSEQSRLFALIARSSGAMVILSGDRHHAEISRDDSLGFPIVDVTSSSLNAPRVFWNIEPNARRVGDRFQEANFGLLLVDWTSSDPALTVEIRGKTGEVDIRETFTLRELAARR